MKMLPIVVVIFRKAQSILLMYLPKKSGEFDVNIKTNHMPDDGSFF